MAEREKRRATTFRTSRGAIVNVAAPQIYLPPGITEDQVKEALREELDYLNPSFLSSSSLEVNAALQLLNIDRYFTGRIFDLSTNRCETGIKPSTYWDAKDGIKSPSGYRWLAFLSKASMMYPQVSLFARIPSLPIGANIQFGVGDDYFNKAAFMFFSTAGVMRCFIGIDHMDSHNWVEITSVVPTNFITVSHLYTVKVNKANVEFWIDEVFVGILIPCKVVPYLQLPSPPYGILLSESDVPIQSGRCRVEVDSGASGNQMAVPFLVRTPGVSPDYSPEGSHIAFGEGGSLPPRTFRLYQTGTTTLWAGMAVLNGVTVTSYPFPLYGYAGKTVDFQATVAGTLFIDVLMQTVNWRVYPPNAGTVITAGVLENFPISGDEVLGRLRFTPAAGGAISDAEVHLR